MKGKFKQKGQLFFEISFAKFANPSISSTEIATLFRVPPFPGAVKTLSTFSLLDSFEQSLELLFHFLLWDHVYDYTLRVF